MLPFVLRLFPRRSIHSFHLFHVRPSHARVLFLCISIVFSALFVYPSCRRWSLSLTAPLSPLSLSFSLSYSLALFHSRSLPLPSLSLPIFSLIFVVDFLLLLLLHGTIVRIVVVVVVAASILRISTVSAHRTCNSIGWTALCRVRCTLPPPPHILPVEARALARHWLKRANPHITNTVNAHHTRRCVRHRRHHRHCHCCRPQRHGTNTKTYSLSAIAFCLPFPWIWITTHTHTHIISGSFGLGLVWSCRYSDKN